MIPTTPETVAAAIVLAALAAVWLPLSVGVYRATNWTAFRAAIRGANRGERRD